jgi:O-antigen ligase
MTRLRHEEPRLPGRDVPFLVLCVALALSLVRSINQPELTVHALGNSITFVPADVALAALAVLCVGRLLERRSLPRPARAITATGAAFAAWLLLSSAVSSSAAFIGAAKLVEYGLLALGLILFVTRRQQLWLLFGVLALVNTIGVGRALYDFAHHPGSRQGAFLGEHDLAALSTMTLAGALVTLYAPRSRGWWFAGAGLVGAIGVTLGAALAQLLGLYLAVAAILALAALRRSTSMRAIVVTLVVTGAVTAGTLSLRSGELGFLQAWFGSKKPEVPGQYAGSWSQRLIFAYIGGRIFIDHPVLGSGWYGVIPPKVYARYVPDARRRFPDQPPRYFPSPPANFIPQQTYDQVLYELGIVGAALFLALAVVTIRTAISVGRRWPRRRTDEGLAYLPAAWVASLAGALAGAALFGGIPMTAIFWFTLGVAAVAPSLMPPGSATAAAT